jgi:transcriptional regulator with XRE-family HTH domain
MARPTAPGWKDLREKTGLTIRQVELLTGINRGEISRIERMRTCPTPDQARRLLVVLDSPGPLG